MQRSTDRIHVSHSGRVSANEAFELEDRKRSRGQSDDETGYQARLVEAVTDVVKRQIDVGIDAVSDGELGRVRSWPYYEKRLQGIEYRACEPGEFGSTIYKLRERKRFAKYYEESDRARFEAGGPTRKEMRMVCSAPLKNKDTSVLEIELERFRSVLRKLKAEDRDAFFPVIAPGWLDHFIFNEHYKTDEEFIYALAEIMRPEYEAIVKAGFIVQIDDPGLTDAWATFNPAPPLEEYRARSRVRVEALNHALRNIPEDRVRYHLCWGSWNGPHVDDLPFKDIVDVMLEVKAQAYSFEAGNVRHEHEWKIWRDHKLPDGKILIPGVVSHRTFTVEHPEVVADRLINFANLVGRENVVAGTDCGMGLRVGSFGEIGWAKLEAGVEGAALASRQLWGR